jgi:hypothetical protein
MVMSLSVKIGLVLLKNGGVLCCLQYCQAFSARVSTKADNSSRDKRVAESPKYYEDQRQVFVKMLIVTDSACAQCNTLTASLA